MKQFTCKSTVTLEGAGIEFDADVYTTYDYAPAEKQTFINPAVDEQYEITDVKVELNGKLVTLEQSQYDEEQIIYLTEEAAEESVQDEYENYEDAA